MRIRHLAFHSLLSCKLASPWPQTQSPQVGPKSNLHLIFQKSCFYELAVNIVTQRHASVQRTHMSHDSENRKPEGHAREHTYLDLRNAVSSVKKEVWVTWQPP